MNSKHSELEVVTKTVEKAIVTTADRVEKSVQKNLFKRFPITLVCAVTFGVVAVTYGAERMFAQVAFFEEYPSVLFLLGLIILMVTGKLYQKLG
jgi:hypothetical protein